MSTNEMKDKALSLSSLTSLTFSFTHPPLLVGGMALMYYGLRESGKDIDFIIHPEDHTNLALSFKDSAKIVETNPHSSFKEVPELWDLYGDHGIIYHKFEIWDSIMLYTYDDLKENAVKEAEFLVISLEKLLLLCSVRGVHEERYFDDTRLIAKELTKRQYLTFDEKTINTYWPPLLKNKKD